MRLTMFCTHTPVTTTPVARPTLWSAYPNTHPAHHAHAGKHKHGTTDMACTNACPSRVKITPTHTPVTTTPVARPTLWSAIPNTHPAHHAHAGKHEHGTTDTACTTDARTTARSMSRKHMDSAFACSMTVIVLSTCPTNLLRGSKLRDLLRGSKLRDPSTTRASTKHSRSTATRICARTHNSNSNGSSTSNITSTHNSNQILPTTHTDTILPDTQVCIILNPKTPRSPRRPTKLNRR